METTDRACSPGTLAEWVADARGRTIDLVADLNAEQLVGPRLPTVNPPLWEIGHAAWFQEYWVLQQTSGRRPILADGHRLFDSISIAHETRWDLPLLSRAETLAYICRVRDEVLETLAGGLPSDALTYFVKLSVFHEDMHTEAYTYTRQTHGYPPPRFSGGSTASCPETTPEPEGDARLPAGDVEVPGAEFLLGAPRNAPFAFDNEKWAHPVRVEPFAIARSAVTQEEFAAFLDDGGYRRRELWSDEGWQWREAARAEHPVYWRPQRGGVWLRRHFDTWRPLEPRSAMIHVNWFEADAYCRWAGRRLPTEAEWERAASGAGDRRHYPWGDDAPTSAHANLDWRGGYTVDVAAHPAGDSPFGCRQMLGNVWEWTATTFEPYPGFEPDPYRDYSRTCFGECQVLRGGCWATRSRLLRTTWRNFYRPDRRDILAGFRTCRR